MADKQILPNTLVHYKYDRPHVWRIFYGQVTNAPEYGLVSDNDMLIRTMPVLIKHLKILHQINAEGVIGEQVDAIAELPIIEAQAEDKWRSFPWFIKVILWPFKND